MTAEEVHREKLKQLGYKDDYIEELVLKYIASCTYEFAEAYHQEKVNSALVSVSLDERRESTVCYHEHTYKKIRFGRELTKCLDCRQIIKQTEN